ncbi:hypothetical protein [Almyronema epifaneia]|uniref:Carboxypeptidase regulatory-like domain-containing protein n=1 Tax=Almyronema epifaneia S1 TaxID=2991925 RepID=A0ABW6IDQ9_9CYAN
MLRTEINPDRQPLNKLQSQRLAALSELSVKEIAGLSVAEISEKFRWRIDPELLLFRRLCGRVVKQDPDTGAEYPVPFATVHVEDTDCNFLGFFPKASPWSWLFPTFCRREEIATVTTDACGRFCVYIPRWEIDWILRFRRERFCFPDIFIKPSIRDLLAELQTPDVIRPPQPQPDPIPLLKDGGLTLQRAEQLVGAATARKLAALEASATFGSTTLQQQQLLASSGFSQPLPPPLPTKLRELRHSDQANQAMDKMRLNIAAQLKLDAQRLEGLDFDRYVGPFRRCVDFVIPEWTPIFDVPDITFRVTQDVDGDGDEEVIYAESFFDVRWNSGSLPDVKLVASQIALAGVACDAPPVACQDVASITSVGLMPVVNPASPTDPYHDAVSGYGRRPNRPHPSGALVDPLPNPLAEVPYAGTLQLYGCNQVQGASFYRLRYRFNNGAAIPFTGLSWPLYRLVGGVSQIFWQSADTAGWYPVLPATENWSPANLLLNWPTRSYQNGLYTVEVELGNASKEVIGSATPINFRVDNSAPTAQFTQLRWRVEGGIWSEPIELICPVIQRPIIAGQPANLEFEVSYLATASHLRSVSLSGGGCGSGSPILSSALSTAQHWHSDPADNSVTNVATFSLPGNAAQGAYSFSLFASSRAFNPAGGDGGFEADWNYDPLEIYVIPRLPVAVVNV